MADETQTDAPKKSPMKMMIVVAALLVVEAGAIVGAMMMFGGPDPVQAGSPGDAMVIDEDEQIVEVLVLDTRLPNRRTGITYVYDTEIYVQVKKKYEERVTGHLQQYENEIKSEISAIWKTSEPHHFQEPKLETLKRKVYALVHERLGTDSATNEPIAQKCVVVMGTGFRIDS